MVTGGYSPGYGPVDDAPETRSTTMVTRSELDAALVGLAER